MCKGGTAVTYVIRVWWGRQSLKPTQAKPLSQPHLTSNVNSHRPHQSPPISPIHTQRNVWFPPPYAAIERRSPLENPLAHVQHAEIPPAPAPAPRRPHCRVCRQRARKAGHDSGRRRAVEDGDADRGRDGAAGQVHAV